jgi:hypothetical protein
MSELGHFRRFARVPDWSGVPQEPDVPGAIRRFGVAPFPDIFSLRERARGDRSETETRRHDDALRAHG